MRAMDLDGGSGGRNLTETLLAAFRERFGATGRVALAPGRVNLVGEHTDYNDGFVLPVAIDRHVGVAFAPRGDETLSGYSLDFDDEGSVGLDSLRPTGASSWFDYASGVAWAYRARGRAVRGTNFVVGGSLPMGAGLASSAALELAVARALVESAGLVWDGREAALVARRAENDFVGVPSGIMDQMVAVLSKAGNAMLLDCRHLTIEVVPLPESLAIVVLDTGTRRAVAASGYRERRESCERAVSLLKTAHPGIEALRDVDRKSLEGSRHLLDETAYRRALHVIEENARTLGLAKALATDDRNRIGELMAASHRSLQELFEVTSPALDGIVETAAAHPACRGCRMTGAGFAGCAVALVEASGVEAFIEDVERSYRLESGEDGRLYPCRAEEGVRLTG